MLIPKRESLAEIWSASCFEGKAEPATMLTPRKRMRLSPTYKWLSLAKTNPWRPAGFSFQELRSVRFLLAGADGSVKGNSCGAA